MAELDQIALFLAWSHVRVTQCAGVWDGRVRVGSCPLKTWKEHLLGKYNVSALRWVEKIDMAMISRRDRKYRIFRETKGLVNTF